MPEQRIPLPEDKSIDTAVCEVLGYCEGVVETAFDRATSIKPCPIGADGGCCKHCAMGPCRLVGKTHRGVCGATRATVAARNFARSVAAGAAAHSDHGRGMAFALLAVANGEAERLPHPRRGEAARGRRLYGHQERRPAGHGHRAGRGRDGAGRVRQADRRAHLPEPCHRRSPGALARSQDRLPGASTARSSRSCTARTWGSTRTPRTSSTRRSGRR